MATDHKIKAEYQAPERVQDIQPVLLSDDSVPWHSILLTNLSHVIHAVEVATPGIRINRYI